MAKKILIVDDEPSVVKGLRFSLEKQEGYVVDAAYDGQAAIESFESEHYDLILLDLMLPKLNGMEVCQRIRSVSDVPIIMLTAKNTEYDRVVGLDSGADDFISKPFGMMELVARVRAVLRRTETREENSDYQLGELFVSPKRHVVKVDGEEVSLTNKEFELLCLLLEHQGMAMTRDAIMDGVWGQEFSRENRTLDVHVRTLRTKLGSAGHYIETVRGVGYKMGGEGA